MEAVLKLRTETAMFLHGASKQTAELRAQAFEGAARYWLRAVLGQAAGGPAALKALEGRVFGSCDAKGLAFHVPTLGATATESLPLLPHHKGNGNDDNPSYSACIPAGAALELIIRPTRRFDAEAMLRAGYCAAWLALHLGGVGQRSRRGAGGCRLLSVSGIGLDRLPVPIMAESLADLHARLSAGVCLARETLHRAAGLVTPTAAPRGLPGFPQLRPGDSIVLTAVGAKDEQQARADVMRKLRPHKNAVFGLPYMKPANGESQIRGASARHASPLWIRLLTLADGTFVSVNTVLRSSTPSGGPGAPLKWSKMDACLTSSGESRFAV